MIKIFVENLTNQSLELFWKQKDRRSFCRNCLKIYFSLKTETNKKRDLIKLTSFCTAKETIKKKKNTQKIAYRMGENICK